MEKEVDVFEVSQRIYGTLFRACVTVSACKRIRALQGQRVSSTSHFCPAQTETPQGQRCRGRLSLLTFFGEAKKVSGCRATPGNPTLHE